MASFLIKDKAKLVNYVLHAKHNSKFENLHSTLGEEFQEIVNRAKPFII